MQWTGAEVSTSEPDRREARSGTAHLAVAFVERNPGGAMNLEIASRWAVIVIALVALGAALRAGSSVFAPLAFGLVLGVVVSPLSDFMGRIGVHRVFSALLSIVVAVVLITGLVLFMEPKVTYAVSRAPQITAELKLMLEGLQGIVRGIDDVSEEVSQAINAGDAAATAQPAAPAEAEPEPETVRIPGVFTALSFAPSFLGQVLIVIGVFFFFLLSRHELYEWIARRRDGTYEGPTARTLMEAEHIVARYFLTIMIINAVLGLAVGVAFHALGMPAPYVWGVTAAAVNYIPYIGPAVFAVAALLGGLLAFDGGTGVLPAVLYICINGVEGNFISPTMVGKNVQVNPLLVFLSLVFWLWLWGPLGGIVAIPILLFVLAVVTGFGVSQTIAFGTPDRSRPNSSPGVGS